MLTKRGNDMLPVHTCILPYLTVTEQRVVISIALYRRIFCQIARPIKNGPICCMKLDVCRVRRIA